MRKVLVTVILISLVLAGCGSRYQAPVNELDDEPRFLDSGRMHRVNGGETLYAVAWMYDLDFAALARANNLSEPYDITPGQMLTVDLRGHPSAPVAAIPTAVATTSAVATATAIQRTPLSTAPLARESLPPAGNIPPVGTRAPVSPPPVATPPATIGSMPAVPAPADSSPIGSTVAIGSTAATTVPTAPVPTSPVMPPPAPVAPPPAIATTIPPVPVPPLPSAPAITPPAPVTTPPVPAVATTVPPAPVVPAPPAAIADASITWEWPASGNIIGRFSDNGMDNKGVDLDGSKGDTVMAAADGEVVYAGSGLLRYGDLVILKHNERFLSAYAHNDVISVKEGDKVTRGQKIAELGSSGIDRNMLHFEIRLDGKPVDPQRYLPSR